MLILVFAVGLVLLPISVQGLYLLLDLVRIQESRQYLEQVIISAYAFQESNELADGQPTLDRAKIESVLNRLFTRNLPRSLKNHLTLSSLEIGVIEIPSSPNHWMGDTQPKFKPVVTINAQYQDYQGNSIPLHHTLELLLN